jgi:IclR family acetate operon transcriptional repressor
MTHRPGAQTHLHSTAMGKAMLAEMSDDEVCALLGRNPLPKLTAKTRVSLPQLVAELHDVRRLGYAINDEENREGFFSAGAVVRDSGGGAAAVLSGAVPTGGLDNRGRTKIINLVLKAAHSASRKLGAPGVSETFSATRSGLSAARRRR